jgi:hypothetical protein
MFRFWIAVGTPFGPINSPEALNIFLLYYQIIKNRIAEKLGTYEILTTFILFRGVENLDLGTRSHIKYKEKF